MTKMCCSMENYKKGEVRELEDCTRLQMSESAVHMKVNYGSKIRNLMGYAIKKMKVRDSFIPWKSLLGLSDRDLEGRATIVHLFRIFGVQC